MRRNLTTIGMCLAVAGALCQTVFFFAGLTRHNILSALCTLLILAGVVVYAVGRAK